MLFTPVQRFNHAFDDLMSIEHGYVNDPDDPGGSTNFGITQYALNAIYKKYDFPDNVKLLTIDDARTYYKGEWWDKYHYEALNSPYIASKVFNMAVNMGAYAAHKLLQESANPMGCNLKTDGILGAQTISAINDICLKDHEEELTFNIRKNQANYYRALIVKVPHLKKFLNGWLNRAAY